MFKRALLGLGFVLASASLVLAQNTTCANRPAGDSSNACANTRFVTTAVSNLFANPTAQVGLTAVNGVANTGIRSDGAPALSQAIAPTWTGRHIWGLTPAYDLAANVLGTGILMPLNSGTQSIAANKQWNYIGLRNSDGSDPTWTLGAGSILSAVYSQPVIAAASDATSNGYAGVFGITNAGPGNAKAFHGTATGSGTSTGTLITFNGQISPVATQGYSSAFFSSLTSSGVNGIAIGYGIETSGDTYQVGFGSAVAPVGYTQAAYRAWMATASAANARAYQVLNNAGGEVGYIHKNGTFQSGLAGTQTGSMGFSGSTSGTATITAQATAGTPTLTLPDTTGTFAVGATSPLALSATTGNLTCSTCVTSSGGGAITGTAPVAVSAAGAVSITGAAGQILAGSGPAFTATPTLGVAGSSVGSLAFANATSGSVTLSPAAGALGSAALTLPALTGTVATTSVAGGGTGAATFTSNGVLYGNSTGAIQATSQGAANTVLVANAGAPSFSAAITVGTSIESPTITGGTASNGVSLTQTGFARTAAAGNVTFQGGTNNGTSMAFQVGIGAGNRGDALTLTSTLTETLTHIAPRSTNPAGATTVPALSSCGTTPAISGTDTAGTVTMGTGSPTGCTITFATAYAAAPHCVVSWRVNIASMQYTTSTSAITLTQTGTSSNLIDYVCFARSGG